MCVCVHVRACACAHVCVCVYVCLPVCLSVHVCKNGSVLYICIHIHNIMYVHVYYNTEPFLKPHRCFIVTVSGCYLTNQALHILVLPSLHASWKNLSVEYAQVSV